ncbi:hypothetical protein ACH42_10460 [Endozoicomonas sp. (ex Bugula neritina AB1)]|nr:hypothetical protein ACH42_10460 [Endozoicomonas sp. (ex Bugula neritina AB1)]
MLGREFKDKHLRLCVVAVIYSGTPGVVEALLLPPQPLKSSVSWDCRTGHNNDQLCQSKSPVSYTASSQIPQPAPQPVPGRPRQMALPVFRPEPILPEREVPAGLPVSNGSESAILIELLNAPENHYVLQWLAANERGSLERLKQRYPVLQDATIAHYRRSEKDWYVLLDGPYQNRSAAMAALQSSPRAQMSRELYPWTRSLASIQKLDLVRPNINDQQLATGHTPEYPAQIRFEPSSAPALANTNYPSQPMPSYEVIQPVFQESMPAQQSVAYGREFDGSSYNSSQYQSASYQSYPSTYDDQSSSEMYASIAPAYRSRLPETATKEVDYNNYQPVEPHITQRVDRQRNNYSRPEHSGSVYLPSENVLNAEPNNYTIEWMTSSRRATLKRAQLRYKEFSDTQILHYQRYNRDRYVLVSKIFGNRRDAVGALSRPSLSRVSARLSPRVRQIGYLQKLVDQIPQQYRRTAKVQPVRYSQPKPRYQQPSRRKAPAKNKPVEGTVLRYAKVQTPAPVLQETIYNAPDNSYTIQWFAANNIESVEKMKARFPELANARTVHFRRNQKDWYVLLQGQFRSSYEAIEAIKNPALKQAMVVLHPWTRPVNSLKKLQIVSR